MRVQNANGSTVSSATTAITITIGTGASGAQLTGTVTRAAVNGVATFADIKIEKAGSGYTLIASAPNLTSATSSSFDVAPASPAKLQVATQPANATAGVAISPGVQIAAQDAFGNAATNAIVNVTVSVTEGSGAAGATLAGTLTQPTVDGVASFGNLTLDKAATGYTLTAAAPNTTPAATSTFMVTAGAPAKLAMSALPTAVTAGTIIGPAVQVAVQDAFDNVVTTAATSVTLAITAGTGVANATLGGTLTQVATSGIATFNDITIDKAGTGYTLSASATGLPSGISASVAVTPGAATRLAFQVQPSSVSAGASINPTIQVVVQDAGGNTVTTAAANVVIAIGAQASGANLIGTVTRAAVDGVASFNDLTIDKSAAGYTLVASSTGLTQATSSQFDIAPGAPTNLAFTTQPIASVSAVAINPAVQVAVQDVFGNVVPSAGASLTVVITNGSGAPGALLTGTTTLATNNGVATFADLKIDKASSNYTLTASAMSLNSSTSSAFAVSPGPAAKLTFTEQPNSATSMAAIAPSVQVTVRDAQDNVVTNVAASVAVAISAGTGAPGAVLGGTTIQSTTNGVATFANLFIDKASTGYALVATATGLVGATSSAFAINVGSAAKVAFLAQPSATAQGAAIAPSIQVAVQDAGGNGVTGSSASITVAITGGTGTGGAILGGTLTTAASGGVATFSDLTVDRPGSGYTLTATATGLVNGTSAQFMINGGTISGTITVVSAFLSVAAAAQDAIAPAAPQVRETTYVPDELIVTFRPFARAPSPAVRTMTVASLLQLNAVLKAEAQSLAGSDATLIGTSPAIRAARLRVNPARIDAVKAALERNPMVARVERNAIVFASGRRPRPARAFAAPRLTPTLPTDPAYVRQAWHYAAIHLDYAWSITTGSNAVIVAVVDDGIRFDHPDIAPQLTNDGYDFVSNAVVPLCGGGTVNVAGDGGGPDGDPEIPNSYSIVGNCVQPNTGIAAHGLHVAGTIGAVSNNGQGGAGINWSVRIRPVRVLNSAGFGTTFDIAQGILYAAGLPADNGTGTPVQAPSAARVINLSLGGPGNSTDLQNAVAAASANGVLIIAAAGNDNTSAPSYPAAYPEVVSVSAVGPDLERASYSNFGSTIDIAAPGGDIADGGADYGVYSTRWNFGTNSPTYQSINGTSMAAPHVAGVAALILAQDPSLTAAQVRALLETYAVDLGAVGRDDSFGFGLLNARNSLTQSFTPLRSTRARLFNAVSGAFVADATVAGNGSYSFTQVPAGSYWVYGGQDEDSDGQFGLPRRRWGALGGSAKPMTVPIAGVASQAASFDLGFAFELEPNNNSGAADVLVIGGHLLGFASANDADFSTVLIPTAGQYTFETQPFRGACGFAEELDTQLELYNAIGTLITANDDINVGALNLCSRITMTLAPGRYYLRTFGYGTILRRYYLVARAA